MKALPALIVVAAALTAQTGALAMHHISGPFDVKVTPIAPESGKPNLGRMALDKQYHGPLEAHAAGEMLSGGEPAKGIGGYVALETVTGTLEGKQGSFQVMHFATMQGKDFHIQLQVVPGSGTGQLTGFSGTMKIIVAAGGKHSSEFDYTLPAQ